MTERVVRVLMVDDTHDQYTMVVDFLTIAETEETQYDVEWASTYEEGIELIQSKLYDVCLIDYELGDANGLELIAHAREIGYQVPMILFTGRGSHTIDLEATRVGAVDYLDKTALKAHTLERAIRYATANQKLLEQERRQRSIAESLLDIALTLNSTLDFDDVLERILVNMKNVIPHDSANIILLENNIGKIVRSSGYSVDYHNRMSDYLQTKIMQMQTFRTMLETRRPLLINQIDGSDHWTEVSGLTKIQSYLGVPIIIQEEVIGFLNFDGHSVNQFTDEHLHYAQIFAQQAAQAIRNTRAYEQAQVLAATRERQRLARDLHDAVSQTLFSASVIAQTLPRFLDSKPEEVRDGLAELDRLNRGALAEMRTLLVELRPQALIETDLPTLIRNLIHAFNSRATAMVESRINYTESLPEDVHIAFYRIAQEALNNIQKYANADHVTIELVKQNSQLRLRIVDDGSGFDPDQVLAGHHGLLIMEERANAIQGDLTVASEIGQGTIIELVWCMNERSENNDD